MGKNWKGAKVIKSDVKRSGLYILISPSSPNWIRRQPKVRLKFIFIIKICCKINAHNDYY